MTRASEANAGPQRYGVLLALSRKIAKSLGIKRKPGNLRRFLNEVFDTVASKFELCKRGFQARATVYGEAFQAIFTVIVEELFPDLKLVHGCEIREACLTGVGKADFVAVDDEGRILAVIETKGSADRIICDGKVIELPRPGLIRTDTTKKAIANAAQVKYGISMDMPYIIVTSHKPHPGSSSYCMLRLVEGKLVDLVVDVTRVDELKRMADIIRKAKPSNLICRDGKALKIGTP